jgi:branched-chain amino acid transport system substrate-binding protein
VTSSRTAPSDDKNGGGIVRHSLVGRLGPILAALAWLVVNSPAASSQEPIKLGIVLPLSGQYGEYVKHYMVAPTDLAVKEVNDKGGLLGRQVTVVDEDSKQDPATAVSAMTKLADVDHVIAVFSAFTPLTLPLLPIAEEKHILVLAPSTEHPDLTKSPWAVRMTPTAEKSGIAIARVAIKLGMKTGAVISEDNEAVRVSVRSFISEFEKLGGKVLGDETFKIQGTDMRGQLTKLRATNADTLYIQVSAGRPEALILKQLTEVGYRPKQIFSSHLIEDKEVQAIGAEMAEGVIYTTLDIDPDFSARFNAAYGYKPDANAGKHYDVTNLLFAAIRKAGTADDTVKIRDAIYNYGDYKGVVGDFNFNGTGEPNVFPILKIVKGGNYIDYK